MVVPVYGDGMYWARAAAAIGIGPLTPVSLQNITPELLVQVVLSLPFLRIHTPYMLVVCVCVCERERCVCVCVCALFDAFLSQMLTEVRTAEVIGRAKSLSEREQRVMNEGEVGRGRGRGSGVACAVAAIENIMRSRSHLAHV